MVDILGSIFKFYTGNETHSSVVVQSLTEGFCHEDEEIRGEGTALFETPRRLKGITRPSIDERGDPWSRDTSRDKTKEGRLKPHLL